MENVSKLDQLIIPVYINEKIVLDMLAIMEDGFSTVSQINYTEHKDHSNSQGIATEASTSSTILSKLLKIDLKGELTHTGSDEKSKSISKEKVHTNVSLLSKFRTFLANEGILKTDFNIDNIQLGDFIEIKGELQKNPLVDYMESFIGLFRLVDIFSDPPQLGGKNQVKNQKQKNQEMVQQIKSFAEELKHSGTIDFILADSKFTAVLSVQEQYMSNDNVSEILGGHFKVLGKVISICINENESIDLLRKTSLSILPIEILTEMVSNLQTEKIKINLPELKTKILAPAVIVIPIAIYA